MTQELFVKKFVEEGCINARMDKRKMVRYDDMGVYFFPRLMQPKPHNKTSISISCVTLCRCPCRCRLPCSNARKWPRPEKSKRHLTQVPPSPASLPMHTSRRAMRIWMPKMHHRRLRCHQPLPKRKRRTNGRLRRPLRWPPALIFRRRNRAAHLCYLHRNKKRLQRLWICSCPHVTP